MPIDPNEPTYCICGGYSAGTMVGCDNREGVRQNRAGGVLNSLKPPLSQKLASLTIQPDSNDHISPSMRDLLCTVSHRMVSRGMRWLVRSSEGQMDLSSLQREGEGQEEDRLISPHSICS